MRYTHITTWQASENNELYRMKHESALPILTFDDIFTQLTKDPKALSAAIGLVAHCLMMLGKGIQYLFTQCYEHTVARWRAEPDRQPTAPATSQQSNTLDLNNPASSPHQNEEELARL